MKSRARRTGVSTGAAAFRGASGVVGPPAEPSTSNATRVSRSGTVPLNSQLDVLDTQCVSRSTRAPTNHERTRRAMRSSRRPPLSARFDDEDEFTGLLRGTIRDRWAGIVGRSLTLEQAERFILSFEDLRAGNQEVGLREWALEAVVLHTDEHPSGLPRLLSCIASRGLAYARAVLESAPHRSELGSLFLEDHARTMEASRRAPYSTLKQLVVAAQGKKLTSIQLRELLVSRHWDRHLEGLALLAPHWSGGEPRLVLGCIPAAQRDEARALLIAPPSDEAFARLCEPEYLALTPDEVPPALQGNLSPLQIQRCILLEEEPRARLRMAQALISHWDGTDSLDSVLDLFGSTPDRQKLFQSLSELGAGSRASA